MRGGKRAFDLALSAFGICLFAGPMIAICLLLLLRSGPPILFRQPRVGLNGKIFTIYKFRTMNPNRTLLPFGEFLRGSAMDELPQLFNILLGHMSFVGPRPLIPEEMELIQRLPGGTQRFCIRPGLAGWAQLYSDKSPSWNERLKLDLAYLSRCSMRTDLWIILRSVLVTLQNRWEKPGPKVHG